jgi:hypothetical protein
VRLREAELAKDLLVSCNVPLAFDFDVGELLLRFLLDLLP